MISKIYGTKHYMREVYQDGAKSSTAPRRTNTPIMRYYSGRYEVYGGFDIKDQLKKIGFSWDAVSKVWWTDNHRKAVRAIKIADAEAKEALKHFLAS